MGDLQGRLAVVTGANTGLGFAITRHLVGHGAHVIMACRNPDRAAVAVELLRKDAATGHFEVSMVDLADLDSIRAFAERLHTTHAQLDLLFNNAGLMALDHSLTADGFEMQFGVNHLGHFALTMRLLPLLLATPGSRIATMSSLMHRVGHIDLDDPMYERRRYSRWGAYAQSKLANMLFTVELQRRLARNGSTTAAVAAHPGMCRTEIAARARGPLGFVAARLSTVGTQSAARGAEPILRGATDPTVPGGATLGPRFGAWGHAVFETPSRRARDGATAERLWTRSAELTGLDGLV